MARNDASLTRRDRAHAGTAETWAPEAPDSRDEHVDHTDHHHHRHGHRQVRPDLRHAVPRHPAAPAGDASRRTS